ncbi:hypothetical protein LJR245_007478 [Rhizobium leguminosarum]|uniref:hypothetical protein n=1 Tax=Rhizobium leguminosarum TaxID=384 RepID=UPI003ECC2BD9
MRFDTKASRMFIAAMIASVAAFLQAGVTTAKPFASCAHMPLERSTAYNPQTKRIDIPWRTDLPTALPLNADHAWSNTELSDWRAYMAAVLEEVKRGDLSIHDQTISMRSDAQWWISPWMDYTANGRERNLGLTRERSPDPGDLAPGSPGKLQVWAVGFYNQEGAYALSQVFAQPCDPSVPTADWTFPANSASFKLLFTNATNTQVPYLDGAPVVLAFIDKPGGGREEQTLRLLQVDIAVQDPRSATKWVFGTFVWKGPKAGDGLFQNLVPVGLMWGNDPTADTQSRGDFAVLAETRLNHDLEGIVWRGPNQTWDERPWPGFQGRLNGPADNLRSSCMSCHALAQWPRSKALGIVPRGPNFTLDALNAKVARDELREKYLKNVVGGKLTLPSEAVAETGWDGATSLDYSLQLEAAFSRLCRACKDGALQGPTPRVCRVQGAMDYIATAVCPALSPMGGVILSDSASDDEPLPRQ